MTLDSRRTTWITIIAPERHIQTMIWTITYVYSPKLWMAMLGCCNVHGPIEFWIWITKKSRTIQPTNLCIHLCGVQKFKCKFNMIAKLTLVCTISTTYLYAYLHCMQHTCIQISSHMYNRLLFAYPNSLELCLLNTNTRDDGEFNCVHFYWKESHNTNGHHFFPSLFSHHPIPFHLCCVNLL